VIECGPAASDEVEKVATRPESVPDPSSVLPSRKVTLPVGAPDVALTVAVNTIELCKMAGLLLAVSAVEVATWLTGAVPTISE
jgi:hypothetical protein